MKTHRFRRALAFCLPLFVMGAASLRATTILSENFDTLTPALTVTSAGVFSAINGTNVDIVGGSLFGYLCSGPESGNCVDMGGSGGNPVGNLALTTPLNLMPGVYDLSFDLIGSQRGQTTSTTVNFGSYSQTFMLTSSDMTSGVVFDQAVTIAGGPTQLTFTNNGGGNGNIGALLDNVMITTPVPEPGTFALLATGLLGAAGAIRRRFIA